MTRLIGAFGCEDPEMSDEFDQLVDDASGAPADTWDFGWLEGRATEQRPSWRYFDRVAERVDRANRLLDVDAGTGNNWSRAELAWPARFAQQVVCCDHGRFGVGLVPQQGVGSPPWTAGPSGSVSVGLWCMVHMPGRGGWAVQPSSQGSGGQNVTVRSASRIQSASCSIEERLAPSTSWSSAMARASMQVPQLPTWPP